MATPIPRNRARLTVAEIVEATGGRAVGLSPAFETAAVATDTRALGNGELFVALRGEHHDGHRFVATARAAGATALVARDAGIEGPRIEVEDTLVALGNVACAHVDRLAARHGPTPLLAIGGAAGKTTTRSLACAAVEALFGPTLTGAGNLNNRIGVPMILLTLTGEHRAVVLECATSERGEIAALGEIARPDVSLVLNLGLEHSAGLGSLDEIADEESQLLYAARRAAIANNEEPLLVERLARAGAANRLTFGSATGASVQPSSRELAPDGRVEIRLRLAEGLVTPGTPPFLTVASTLLGPHAAQNFAAATLGALALLGRPAIAGELAAVARALGAVAAVPGRLRPLQFGDLLLLDDAYNSNPRSAAAAVTAARELADRRAPGRLVLFLGDMLELGAWAPTAHDELLALALAAAPHVLAVVGAEICAAAERSAEKSRIICFADSVAAAAASEALIASGDLVLVKGSRGMRMERIAVALAAHTGIDFDPGL